MGIFDFNGDGKTSFGEELFGLGIAGMIIDDMEREEREQQDLLDEGDEDADDDPDVDDEDAWREKYVYDASIGVDPEDYDDEDEYLEAMSSLAWRKNYEYDSETDIDPEDYDEEDEYLEELKEAKEWIVNSKSDSNYKVRDLLNSTGDR